MCVVSPIFYKKVQSQELFPYSSIPQEPPLYNQNSSNARFTVQYFIIQKIHWIIFNSKSIVIITVYYYYVVQRVILPPITHERCNNNNIINDKIMICR